MTVTDRIAAGHTTSDITATGLWIALIAGMSVLGSFAFACVAPLAAISALAARTMGRAEGLALVVTAWVVNQAVGFLLLSYPHSAESYAWGAALGVASVLSYFAATAATSFVKPTLPATVAAFVAAFAIYQLALYAFGVATSYTGDSFSMAIVSEVFWINAVAFVGFLIVHRAAVALTLMKPAQPSAPASA